MFKYIQFVFLIFVTLYSYFFNFKIFLNCFWVGLHHFQEGLILQNFHIRIKHINPLCPHQCHNTSAKMLSEWKYIIVDAYSRVYVAVGWKLKSQNRLCGSQRHHLIDIPNPWMVIEGIECNYVYKKKMCTQT